MLLATIVLVGSAKAEDVFLLPVTPSTIQGAFGTSWHTVMMNRNDTGETVTPVCAPGVCVPIPPKTTAVVQAGSSGRPAFVYLAAGRSEHFQLALRTTAISPSTTMVMEVPVVPLGAFRADASRILGVPFAGGSRQSLRIYTDSTTVETQVRLQIETNGSTPAVDTVLTLSAPADSMDDGRLLRPSWIAINDLASVYPQIAGAPLATVTVTPITEHARVWAFITSVNNATQQFNNFLP